MSSDEDFDATPGVRQSTEHAKIVLPYMFEPLAAKRTTPGVESDSDNESTNDSFDDINEQLIVNPQLNSLTQGHVTREAEAGFRQDESTSTSFEQEWCVAVSIRNNYM